ncbi:MAG: hypothetical protein ACXQT5_05405 [Candidatus Syntropharchaeia archaeon]
MPELFEDFSKIGPFRDQSEKIRYVGPEPSDDRPLSDAENGFRFGPEIRHRETDTLLQTVEHWVNRGDIHIHDQWMRIFGRKNRVQRFDFIWLGCSLILPSVKGEYYLKPYSLYDSNEPIEFQLFASGQYRDFAVLNNISNTPNTWISVLCTGAGHMLYTRKIRLTARRTITGCALTVRFNYNRCPCHDPQIYVLWRRMRLLKAEIKKIKVDNWLRKNPTLLNQKKAEIKKKKIDDWFYRPLLAFTWPKEYYPEIWELKKEIKRIKAEGRANERVEVPEPERSIEEIKKEIAEIKKERKRRKEERKKAQDEYVKKRKKEIREYIREDKKRKKKLKAEKKIDEMAKKRTYRKEDTREIMELDEDTYDYYSDTTLRKQSKERALKLYPSRKPRSVDSNIINEILHKDCRGGKMWGSETILPKWERGKWRKIGNVWYVRMASYFFNFLSSILYYSGGYSPVPRPAFVRLVEVETLLDDFINWLILRVL